MGWSTPEWTYKDGVAGLDEMRVHAGSRDLN